MRRPGGASVAFRLVLLIGAAVVAGAALAQDTPAPAPPGGREARKDARAAVSVVSMHDVAAVKSGDEWSLFLRGDSHLAIESAPERSRPGTVPERQRLDIRAEDTVIFIPAEKDGLAPDPTRLSTSVRAIYCEGHVAFVQETLHGETGRRSGPAFRLEARSLYIDLVRERVYAEGVVATLPGGTKRAGGVGPGSSAGAPARNVVSQQATFTLRAEKLRLRGTDELVAEGASLSVCDFGRPHEAVEGDRIVLRAVEGRKRPAALTAAAALGDVGGTYVGWRAERDLPFRAFREISRSKVRDREGSDAIEHAERDPRSVQVDGAELRVRPPFLGEDGLGLPFPLPIPWETDWLVPQVRFGHSSKFGWFGAGELKVPVVKPDVVHERTNEIAPRGPDESEDEYRARVQAALEKAEHQKEDGDRHVREGLELDAIAAGADYEKRGPAGDPGVAYEYRDARGQPELRGQLRGFFLEDKADFDRNGTPVTRDDRYWIRGVHQQELNPASWLASALGLDGKTRDSPADHVKLDAEVSKQSDRDLLYEYFRGAAYGQKEQETYVYLRRAWDDLGARFISKWRLNDFQSQTEELPAARIDFLQTPLIVTDTFGGTYLTVGVEGAHLRTRADDAIPNDPDQRLGRGDFAGRLDYKLPLADLLYAGAFAEGRYTAWSQAADHSGAIDRVIGATGAHLGSQADGEAQLGEKLWVRHVIQPEVGFYDRYYVSKEPEKLIPVSEIESYRPGEYVFLRLRNRIQYAEDGAGKKAHDLLDITVEDRYYPTNERLNPNTRMWDTALGDGRLSFGRYGSFRTEVEVDPTRHALLKLESTLTLQATRSVRALATDATPDDPILYPDVGLTVGYHDVVDLTRAVSWGVDVRLTASWGFRAEQVYDFLQHSFLRHRVVVTRRFHSWALQGTGSYDPILHDTAFTFSVLPMLEDEDSDPFREGLLSNTHGDGGPR